MNSYLFIYLTREEYIANVATRSRFNPRLGFNKDLPFYLISESVKVAKGNLDETDCPCAILVYDSMDADTFCQNVSKISSRYAKIFIVYHTLGICKDEISRNKSCLFTDKWIFELGQNEGGNSFYLTAVKFINAINPEKIKSAQKEALEIFKKYNSINEDNDPF